ncbi:kinesin-like nuclear fusion protein [Rhizophlyctis rosea]|nr:kinesin-like nuclear fusion protein [Rhizophlyctis rosea]
MDEMESRRTTREAVGDDDDEEVPLVRTSKKDKRMVEEEHLTQEKVPAHRLIDDDVHHVDQRADERRGEEGIRRKLHNTVQELKGNIRVFCRVQPPLEAEKEASDGTLAHMNFKENAIELYQSVESASSSKQTTKTYPFTFDKVFRPESTQSEVFEEISQLVQSALIGYNVCIFAYGQTGSGKTFTMEGPPLPPTASSSSPHPTLQGMIPRTVQQIFDTAEALKESGWEYSMEGTFLEIYDEVVRDLLEEKDEKAGKVESGAGGEGEKTYEIRHLPDGKTVVERAVVATVKTPSEVHRLLRRASHNRSVASTLMNDRSSRSIFSLHLTGANQLTGKTSNGVVNLIDLAGSERLDKSGSGVDKERLKETHGITRSLSALGDVVERLALVAEGVKGRKGHVPFRNSKLTYLLQNSLGGNSKTLMFVNVSSLEKNFGETLCSLKFATKVQSKTKAKRQKRAIAPSKALEEYQVGEVVWAKMRGYPWWPGRVAAEDYLPDIVKASKHARASLPVHFFGTGDYTFCKGDKLRPFEQCREELSKKTKTPAFLKALREADDPAIADVIEVAEIFNRLRRNLRLPLVAKTNEITLDDHLTELDIALPERQFDLRAAIEVAKEEAAKKAAEEAGRASSESEHSLEETEETEHDNSDEQQHSSRNETTTTEKKTGDDGIRNETTTTEKKTGDDGIDATRSREELDTICHHLFCFVIKLSRTGKDFDDADEWMKKLEKIPLRSQDSIEAYINLRLEAMDFASYYPRELDPYNLRERARNQLDNLKNMLKNDLDGMAKGGGSTSAKQQASPPQSPNVPSNFHTYEDPLSQLSRTNCDAMQDELSLRYQYFIEPHDDGVDEPNIPPAGPTEEADIALDNDIDAGFADLNIPKTSPWEFDSPASVEDESGGAGGLGRFNGGWEGWFRGGKRFENDVGTCGEGGEGAEEDGDDDESEDIPGMGSEDRRKYEGFSDEE